MPPLLRASEKEVEVVKMLIEAGANIEAAGNNQGRPMHWANAGGHVEVVHLLLEAKANIDAEDDKWGARPRTLLDALQR